MKLKDSQRIKGIFHLEIYKKGKLIEKYEDKNLIVNVAKESLAKLVAGDGPGKTITKIGFGTNGDGPYLDDTALTNAYVKSLSGHSYPEAGQVQFNFTLATNEANGMLIKEFGLLCDDGSLFARKTRGTIEKQDDISLSGSWTIIF